VINVCEFRDTKLRDPVGETHDKAGTMNVTFYDASGPMLEQVTCCSVPAIGAELRIRGRVYKVIKITYAIVDSSLLANVVVDFYGVTK
jgi:hypothetical protein